MKKLAMVAISGFAVLGLTGCSADDSVNPVSDFRARTVGQACTVMTLQVLDLQWPLIAWQAGGMTPEGSNVAEQWNSDKLDTVMTEVDEAAPEQVAVEAVARRVKDLASKLTDAVEAKDDAQAQEIVDAAKAPVDEFLARCSSEPDWSGKESVADLRADLDEKPRR